MEEYLLLKGYSSNTCIIERDCWEGKGEDRKGEDQTWGADWKRKGPERRAWYFVEGAVFDDEREQEEVLCSYFY